MKAYIITTLLVAGGILLSGCSSTFDNSFGSTAKRTAIKGGAAAGAGALGYALSDEDPIITAASAAGGYALADLALGDNPEAIQRGFDKGYVQGQSDAVKRLYWAKQRMEQRASSAADRTRYMSIPMPTETEDGRKLKEHYLTVPVVE